MYLIYISGVCASTSEVIYYGGFYGQVLLDSDWASQLRSVLQFLSQAQVPGLSVTITTEFSFLGLNKVTGYCFM